MISTFTSALIVAAETAHESPVHTDSLIIGGIVLALLLCAVFVTMSFSRVAVRHPETPVRNDPHRVVHSRADKH